LSSVGTSLRVSTTRPDGRDGLVRSLGRLRGRLLRLGGGAASAWALAGAIGCLIIGTWADLVFELSPALRIGVLAASAGMGLGLLIGVIARAWRSGRAGVLARRLDEVGATGGQISAGADLLDDRRIGSPLSRGLARMAIERAAQLAEQVAPSRAVSARPLVVASGTLLAAVAVIALAWAIERPLVVTEYLRFSDPFGDHPPYSRVSFAVEPGNSRVVYGASQEIRVTTGGGPVDRLDLVLLSSESGPPQVLPMFGEPGGVWRATIASVSSPVRYFARCNAGRSHRFELGVVTLPRLEAVRFRITPPAYTNRGAYEGGLPQGGLAGLPGTSVQVWAKSNRPLAGGSLEVTSTSGGAQASAGTRAEMVPVAAGDHEVSAVFEIREPGRFELRVRDVEGQESQDVFATAFSVLADERPFVRLLEPPAMSLATADVPLPVVLAAEDDYGVSRLSLYRSLNDSRALPLDLPVPVAPPSRRENHASALVVPAYDLRPGDEIKLFARVEDNDPVGAKGAESPIAVVRIISQEEYERLVLTRQGLEVLTEKYQQARRRMEEIAQAIKELQEELENQADDEELAAETRAKIAELAERMQQEAGEIAKAAESTLPFDIDKSMNEHLRELADKLAEAGQELAEFAKSEPSPKAGETKEGLEAILEFCEGKKREFEEQTTEPLEMMAKIYRLMEDEARFTALYQRQLDLANRLDSLRGNDSGEDPQTRARMRDLESEQYRIREDLKVLVRDIEHHAQQLPDDPSLDELRETASAFAAALRESGAADAMADAEGGLAAFSGTRGAEGAREAEQILKQFLGQCQSMGQGGQQCMRFQPGLGDRMGNTVEQLLAGAGMKTGQGGMGAGGGYSAQTSTLDNVGLFGRLPALGGGGLNDDSRGGRSALQGRRSHEGNFESAEPGRVDPLEALRATGAGQQLVPPEYRQRVGVYLERIADEVGEQRQEE